MAESNAVGGLIRSNSKESIISAISHVGNWEIGDRCLIGGRMGNVVYIGQTRFAAGEWIGIVLDQPLGKNDGSVDGHRYFSCEPNHGLFCKASKLERVQSPSMSTGNNPLCKEYGLELGDRVIVSGGKCGRLRFLGSTDFKDGVWAGIELDQPVGKNDGSVQGKRYFTCKAPYGLFAAASKVIRAPDQNAAKFKIRHTKTSALRQRKGSYESLSSIGASSVASSRISKYNFATPRSVQKPFVISSVSEQEDLFKAMKESLKEKETHLEQMIKERDLERNEMAALSNRCELAEAKVTQLENAKTLVDQQLETLKVMLAETEAKFNAADGTVNDLTVVLRETKDALEDLTFRYDEEVILNAEMAEKIVELEKSTLVKEGENEGTTKILMDEIEKAKLQIEEMKKQCTAFEQERLSVCAGMRKLLSIYKEDHMELVQLLSLSDIVGNMDENGLPTTENDRDLSKQLEMDMEGLSILIERNKVIKKAVEERFESNMREINDLVYQLDILKKSVDDKAISFSQKDVELTGCQENVDQLRKELEKLGKIKAKLEEKYEALKISNDTLLRNFGQLNKENDEMNEKMKDETEKLNVEITRLSGELQETQNVAIQLQEQLEKVGVEKTKLVELQELLENSNRKLLADTKLLQLQKIDLEGKLKQKESENEMLSSSLAKREVKLASIEAEINDLISQINRLFANLWEASSNDESQKNELKSLLEEIKGETAFPIIQLQTTNESLEKSLSTAKGSFQALENIHNVMKYTLGKTHSELEKLKKELSSSQQELISEQEKVAKLQLEIVSHASAMEQLQKFQEEAANAAEIQSPLQSDDDTQRLLYDLEAEREILLKEKAEMQTELMKVRERYEVLMQSLEAHVNLDTDYREKIEKFGAQLKRTSNCKSGSLEEKIITVLEEEIQLKDTEKRLKVEIEKLMTEKAITAEKFSGLESERSTFVASLNGKEKEQNEKDVELNLLKAEMINFKDECKNKDAIIKSLEAEILKLSKKQAENDGTISEAKQRCALFVDLEEEWKSKENAYIQEIQELKTAVGKTETDKIGEMEQKISFLNSIIAKQYREEENLKEQIAILNSLPANQIITELERKTMKDVSLRLYCDICEVFDVHDTTDCPTQAMDVEDDMIRTKAKKVKPSSRPYCEHCEEFGHDKSSCSEIQTEKPRSKDYTF